ncbi:hypothetical protein HN512_03710 [Candidatus Peregrinibacteria bacterium]|nr:hypothetical protein [Candidatus Peregrinibacteria bacterium]
MKIRGHYSVIILLTLLMLPSVIASSDYTSLNLPGCSNDEGLSLLPETCSANRDYFCPAVGPLVNTMEEYCDQDTSCCPTGYFCNVTSRCVLSEADCSTYLSESECITLPVNGVCFWFNTSDDSGFCTEDRNEGNCGIYASSDACKEDTYNFAVNGDGAEVCRGLTVLGQVINDCACEWNTNECELSYTADRRFSADGNPYSLSCSKSFDTSDCTDGKQNVTKTSRITHSTGYSNAQLAQAAEEADCVNQSSERLCGAAAVKLPGFSTYAAILAILAIVLYYLYNSSKQNNKKKKTSKNVGGARSRTPKGAKK